MGHEQATGVNAREVAGAAGSRVPEADADSSKGREGLALLMRLKLKLAILRAWLEWGKLPADLFGPEVL